MVDLSLHLGPGVLSVAFFLFVGSVGSLMRSSSSPLDDVVAVFGAFCSSLLPLLYFSTHNQDMAGRLMAYGVLLFSTGYACLGASLMPRE